MFKLWFQPKHLETMSVDVAESREEGNKNAHTHTLLKCQCQQGFRNLSIMNSNMGIRINAHLSFQSVFNLLHLEFFCFHLSFYACMCECYCSHAS